MNSELNKKWVGHLAVLTVYIIFGINPNCSKAVVPEYITPEAYTALRLVVGAVGFWIISLFIPQEKVAKRDIWMIVFGAVSLYGTLWAFAEAMRYISPTYVSLISAMSPLVVMLMAALFLKEPITTRKAMGVFFGIAGALMMILFSLHGDTHYSNIGALLCFVNILFYATYLLITRAISPKYSPVTMMKWMFLFSAVLSLPLAIPTVKDSPILMGTAPAMAYVNMGIVALFATVLAYYLLPVALRHIRPTTVSMYSNLQPIVTAALAIAIGQDVFTWNKPIALLLVIFGVFLVTTSRSKDSITQ
ncbi:MAG: DMT family transporter [Bacteroidales bacterium]|nr:DMT family transporter [Bacteroidales bacterium]